MNPVDRKYSKDHEWAQAATGNTVTIGITHYAQDQLGDIVYLDLPALGDTVEKTKKLGEVESVKTVSDVYSPLSGVVVEVNQHLIDHPELVNEDPFGDGWLLKVASANATKELESLLTSQEYDALLESEDH